MSYDETVRQDLYEGLTWALTDRRSLVDAADVAIPPLTLKTEDGRFAKVVPMTDGFGNRVYRLADAEDQP